LVGPALMRALDTNADGKLSGSEISDAAAALKKLDKNGDGKLTRDEYLGGRPGGGGPGRPGAGGGADDAPPSRLRIQNRGPGDL
jgi:hypothetical protein